MRTVNTAREFRSMPKVGGDMRGWRTPKNNEDGVSRLIWYLLAAFTISIGVKLLIQGFRW